MAWIEVHQGLFRHRKTVSAGHLLDIPRMSAGGHIISLWLWALDNAPYGDLTTLSPELIAFGADWEGDPHLFTETLVAVGFLDRIDGILTIHDWYDYAGRLIERRNADKDRKRVRRTGGGQAADRRRTATGNPLLPYPTVPYRTNNIYTPAWLGTLREIDGWSKRGEPHETSLLEWVKRKGVNDDQLEKSAIGLAHVQAKTLNGYANLTRAFQDRINKGYDSGVHDAKSGRNPPQNAGENDIQRAAREQRERQSAPGYVPPVPRPAISNRQG